MAIKILIVDDEPTIRRCMSGLITAYMGKEYETKEAENAETGYNAFLKYQPDLILLDFQMPGADGPSLARHIRTHHADLTTKIIGFTAKVGDADISAFDGIIQKPIRGSNLKQELMHYLDPNFTRNETQPDSLQVQYD